MFAPFEKIAKFFARLFRKEEKRPFYLLSIREQTKRVCMLAVRKDPENLNRIHDPYMQEEVAKELGMYDDDHMDVFFNCFSRATYTREEYLIEDDEIKRVLREDWKKFNLNHSKSLPAEGI